jgi:hypothetical protein
MTEKTALSMDRLSFSYPEKLQEILREEAIKELRTLPSYIKRILNAYLKHIEKQEKK